MRGLPRVATLLVLAVAVGGCGGDEGGGNGSSRADDQEATKQVSDYFAAFNRADGASACALLTPQAQAGLRSLSDRITAPDCEGAIRELARISAHIRSPRITVEVTGERAIARVRSRRPAYQSDVLLQKHDDGWLIAFPPAMLERFNTPPGVPDETGEHDRG